MKTTPVPAGALLRLSAFLAAALLLLSPHGLLQEEAYFLLAPLLAFALLSGSRPGSDPFLPFRREARGDLPSAALFTALFFVQLPVWKLLGSPLFSESGLSAFVWRWRILRLAFLWWNRAALLPLSAYAALWCAARLFRSLPQGGAAPVEKPARPDASLWILFFCAILCLVSTVPSVFDPDAATLWHGSVTGIWSDWHLVTYRFFIRLCSMLYYSRFTVTLVQTCLFLAAAADTARYLDGIGKGASRAFIGMLLLFFNPVFMVQILNKDVPFAAALLGLTVSVLRMVRGERGAGVLVRFGLYGYIVLSFRHAGILPLLGAFAPAAIFALRRDRGLLKGLLLSFGSACILYVLIAKVLAFGILHAIPNPGYIKYGTPMQTIASVADKKGRDAFREEEIALMEEVMPFEKWASCFTKYYPGTISRAYSLIGEDVYKVEEKGLGPKLTLLSVRLMLRFPSAAAGTVFDNASVLWALAWPEDQSEAPYDGDTGAVTDMQSYTGAASFTFPVSHLMHETPVLRSVTCRGGAATFLLAFAAYTLIRRRRAEAWALLPAALLFAGLFITVPSPSTRYVLPFMDLAALFLPLALRLPPSGKTDGSRGDKRPQERNRHA